jgi:hypothetical protein
MIRMAIQVVLIDEAEDRRDVHEIVRIERAALCAEGLGLSLAEGKEISGGIQRVLAGAQVAAWQEANRTCPECGRAFTEGTPSDSVPHTFRHVASR